MNLRVINIAVMTAGIAAAPMLCAAANSPAAFDSCVKAFMTKLSSKYASAPTLRQARYLDDGSFYSTNELELTAWNPHNNQPVARAVCTYDAEGRVLQLQGEPLYGLPQP
jgi:hypothetical protein